MIDNIIPLRARTRKRRRHTSRRHRGRARRHLGGEQDNRKRWQRKQTREARAYSAWDGFTKRPRRQVTERQLIGLLLYRTEQRRRIDRAIAGIQERLRAMGSKCADDADYADLWS